MVQGAAPEGNECNGHSGLRRGVDVRFEGRNAPLERFISDLRNVPGIYALVVGGNALDCQRTKRNETSGLGERPLHHLDAAYGDHAARAASPTITLSFHATLIRCATTIRWMPWHPGRVRQAERAVSATSVVPLVRGSPGIRRRSTLRGCHLRGCHLGCPTRLSATNHSRKPASSLPRRGGRAVECGGLENR